MLGVAMDIKKPNLLRIASPVLVTAEEYTFVYPKHFPSMSKSSTRKLPGVIFNEGVTTPRKLTWPLKHIQWLED